MIMKDMSPTRNYEYNADILHEKHPKFSFGKEIQGESRAYKTPGSGQYEYKKFIGKESTKNNMSAKYDSRLGGDTKYVPRPGQYDETNTNKYRNKNPAYRIGTAKRQRLYIIL